MTQGTRRGPSVEPAAGQRKRRESASGHGCRDTEKNRSGRRTADLQGVVPLQGRTGLTSPPGRILIIPALRDGQSLLGTPCPRIREKYPASISTPLFEKNREILRTPEVIPPETHDDRRRSWGGSPGTAWRLPKMPELRSRRDRCGSSPLSSIFRPVSRCACRAGFHRHTMEGYTGETSSTDVPVQPLPPHQRQFLALVDAIDSRAVRNKFRLHGSRKQPRHRLRKANRGDAEKTVRRLPAWKAGSGAAVTPAGNPAHPGLPIESFAETAQALVDRGTPWPHSDARRQAPARSFWSTADRPLCVDLTGLHESIRELLVIFTLLLCW